MISKKQASQIVGELKEQRKYNDEEILEYLKAHKITESKDMLKIIDAMLQHEPYFNFFIGNNFTNYAETSNKFFEMVVRLSKIDRFGYDVSNLGKLYENNPETVNFLYEKLRPLDEYKIALTVGYILGGIGNIEPQRLWDIIDANKKPTINEQISYACALYRVSQDKKIPKKFVDLLISYANSDEKNLRHHAIGVLMIWFNSVKRIQTFLTRYAKQNEDCKELVLRNVSPIIRQNPKLCFRLLKICSGTEDHNLIHRVAMDLGILAPQYPVEVLTILKKWCKTKGFHFGQWPGWAAEEAGKGDIKMIEKFLLEWINKEKNGITMQFHLPHILDEIYKGKDNELMRILKKIDFRHKRNATLIVKTMEKSLSEGFRKIERSESFLNSCNAILMKIAEHQELEVYVEPAATKEPVMYTLALVSSVNFGKKKIPPDEVKKNLEYFPNVVSFFGKSRLEKLIEKKPFHPLIKILSRVPVSDDHVKRVLKRIDKQEELWQKGMMLHAVKSRYYPMSLFYDMDASFAMFKENERGKASIRDGMLDENNFFPTLIELNVSARFKKRYPTTLQPPIGGNNKLDVAVDIDGSPCLFEIYAPKEDLRMKYVRTVHSMKNKAKSGILTKLERQLKSAEGMGCPVVLIIDKSDGASVDEIEIGDSLFGTYQWTMMMDKEKGEVVDEYATRKRDSISEISPYGKIISAVVLLKRDMDDADMKVKLYGKTFLNPDAVVPISKEMVQKIENTILGQAVI